MQKTQIEWALNPDGSPGYTWNPITGCLNHANGLCKGGGFPCYAYKLAHRRLRQRYLANDNWPRLILNEGVKWPIGYHPSEDPFYPRFWEEKLKQMASRNNRLHYDGKKVMYPIKPRGIFPCDMGDLFGQGVPEAWTQSILDEIWGNKGFDRFYLLTKQPRRLPEFSPFPDNAWVGVTVCNADMYLPAMKALDSITAKVKYVSFEPLLENPSEFCEQWSEDLNATIDWLIVGACTGSYIDLEPVAKRYPECSLQFERESDKLRRAKWTLQPRIEWVREIVEAASRAGIKVFLKDNLIPLLKWPDSGAWAFKDASNIIRQEMPHG